MKLNIKPCPRVSRTHSLISLLLIIPVFFTTYFIRFGEFLVGSSYNPSNAYLNIAKELLSQLSLHQELSILVPAYKALNIAVLTIPVSLILIILMMVNILIAMTCACSILNVLFAKSPPRWTIKYLTIAAHWYISMICWVCLIQRKPIPPENPLIELENTLLSNHSRFKIIFKVFLIFPHIFLLSLTSVAIPFLALINHISVLLRGQSSPVANKFIIGIINWSISVWLYFPMCMYDTYPSLKINRYFKPL